MPVYLLHFDRPYKHARHYLGYSRTMEGVERRIAVHRAATPGDGQNHRLLSIIREAGITFTVAKIWPEATRQDERQWKKGASRRRCPICQAEAVSTGADHD